ncbi:MAG: type I polyketide synthase [Rhodothermaceae bacterium]|nr:type I polyketide synthase [Rhodothermaceae bacterium]
MDGIAIIGLSGRFPGAQNVKTFWQNLVNGVNSIVPIPEEELNLTPQERKRLLSDPNFVPFSATIKDADHFDAPFFGIYPREAQAMDPQHRLFLECSWEAIEDAGYEPSTYPGSIGVFAGSYMNTYTLCSLESHPSFIAGLADSFHGGTLQHELGNDKDYLSTRVSFKLNLRGPSITVQTACSTSLVAVAQACMSLSYYQCDMALAGAATLKLPANRGYLYQPDGMVSPDGICRTFDANSRGTVFGDGVSVVLLKRLEDAIEDGDSIYAVIKGWGVNNDGASKVGYTAPSVDGQKEVIAQAHALADFDPRTISYMEAHGTGTPIGDPIEIDALTQAFRMGTEDNQFCAIGSVKTNIGHLDVAAGCAGLIKTSLALANEQIPPSLNFESPNPNIDFENTPFYVNDKLRPWERSDAPRRAGLSSFGVGGTNAHVVLEEAPLFHDLASERPNHLITLSARSTTALDHQTANLLEHIESHPELLIEDIAYTLQVGRADFNYKRSFVATDREDCIQVLKEGDAQRISTTHGVRKNRSVVFMFPGQGAQHVNMGKALYESEPIFRREMDICAHILEPILGFDIRNILYPTPEGLDESMMRINETMVAQPGIFSISYSLAKYWMSMGLRPTAMIGHSVGEFVAATLAGIFSLEDALHLVAKRGTLMQDLPSGSMMAVRMPAEELEAHLTDDVSIAAVNSAALCVVSGPDEAVEALQADLEAKEIICRPLHTSHAFHSAMMDPAVAPFEELLSGLTLSAPEIPIVSTAHGRPLTEEDATNPAYWAQHLRATVLFAPAVSTMLHESNHVFLEIGPGQTLSTLTRQHPSCTSDHDVFSSSPHAKQEISSYKVALETLGKLWQTGILIDWKHVYQNEQRKRVHLPTYPFERKRYWFDSLEPTTEDDFESASVSNGIHPEYTNGQSLNTNGHAPPVPQSLSTLNPDTRTLIENQLQLMSQQLQAWNQLLSNPGNEKK